MIEQEFARVGRQEDFPPTFSGTRNCPLLYPALVERADDFHDVILTGNRMLARRMPWTQPLS